MPEYLETTQGRRIAYYKSEGKLPTVVFLGGFKSDMAGSKATFLEDWSKSQGQSYLRFDYSGHGQSSENFTDGCIGDWADDSEAVLAALTDGPLILIGSSMGGWISLLLARRIPQRIVGLLTIAAAPDFTQDRMWPSFSEKQQDEVMTEGVTLLPSEYGDPYPITRRLIEDGKNHLVLQSPLSAEFPVRMLQGSLDTSVTQATALKLFDHLEAENLQLNFIKGGDHSLSTLGCLEIIKSQLLDLLNAANA
jgi:pimeloyl-ACP methyl ester carboxylesterase